MQRKDLVCVVMLAVHHFHTTVSKLKLEKT